MITGDILIGAQRVSGGERSFRAVNPATGEAMEPAFAFAGPIEVERACALAWDAFHIYRETGPDERARFLETIATSILDIGDALIDRAGGDTASALAAGCPVVVKGHPAHPGTSELVGQAIQAAVASSGLPEGVFSLLLGEIETGSALVADPHIKAVGFTGSRGGGMALVGIAASRPEPIPVYAEMSSSNPVYLLPAALSARADAIGREFITSLTMGAGQFCTNPGLVFGVEGSDLDRFIDTAATALKVCEPQPMLTPGIHKSYERGVQTLSEHNQVETVARGRVGQGVNQGQGALFATDAQSFLADERLGHEVFGSSSLVVRCPDPDTLVTITKRLEGQLTATLQMEPADVG